VAAPERLHRPRPDGRRRRTVARQLACHSTNSRSA
jgi:hypothetical protein